MLKSLCIAFSTFSRIPVPRVEWNEKSLRWAVCFFPLVGVVVGIVELLWFQLAAFLGLPELLRGGIAAAIPILLTGGIHLDGFCDTADALASHQPRERMLEILKDSNAGAFAVIYFGVWLMLWFCAWSSLRTFDSALAAGLSFVLSRALSGLALTRWQQARPAGMLRTVADAAKKRTVTAVMLVYIALCLALLPLLTGWLAAGAALLGCGLAFALYRLISYRRFGGVTGDLAGFFVSLAELFSLLILVLTEAIV